MIDFHSHILPGIDDGLANIEDSIQTIEEAKKAGFDTIIATTHYSIPDEYVVEEKIRIELLDELQSKVKDVKIILGNEIYINGMIDMLIEEKKISTINNTKYILFELPLVNEYPELKNIVLNLMSQGYKLILAHPERYTMMQQNPKQLEELIDMGVYLQANFLSILGFYGKEAKKTVELLFRHGMISFLGTDVHRKEIYYPNVEEAKKQIIEIIGQAEFDKISELNPKRAIENEKVDLAEYSQIKKNFLGKFK